jgi:hypothetical protein
MMRRGQAPVPGRPRSRSDLLRLLAIAPLPAIVWLWALWRDVYVLEAQGLSWTGGPRQLAEWGLLSVATAALAGLFFVRERALRVLGYTFYALVLSVAFGAAGVLAVFHAFGGPSGHLAAPGWALALLAAVAALCVMSLLATAGLIVEDVRSADGEPD